MSLSPSTRAPRRIAAAALVVLSTALCAPLGAAAANSTSAHPDRANWTDAHALRANWTDARPDRANWTDAHAQRAGRTDSRALRANWTDAKRAHASAFPLRHSTPRA